MSEDPIETLQQLKFTDLSLFGDNDRRADWALGAIEYTTLVQRE